MLLLGKRVMRLLVLALLLLEGGCFTPAKKVTVGRDLTWFPYSFGLFSPNINAFVNAVATEVGHKERLNINVVNLDWIALTETLREGKTDGAFTTLMPNFNNIDDYEFSEPLLLTGPVLVVRRDSPFKDFQSLKGRKIGVYLFDWSSSVAQKIPEVIIASYEHIPTACEDLVFEKYDALLVPALDANNLIHSVYEKQLQIVSEPLTPEGIRLITLKNKDAQLISMFNNGLNKIKNNSVYAELKKTYSVP